MVVQCYLRNGMEWVQLTLEIPPSWSRSLTNIEIVDIPEATVRFRMVVLSEQAEILVVLYCFMAWQRGASRGL